MAKTTYTGTLFYTDNLQEAEVRLYIYSENKYEQGVEEAEKVVTTGLKSWTIVEGGREADAIETIMDEPDVNREYLILNFVNGNTEIYCNSKVTMFIC